MILRSSADLIIVSLTLRALMISSLRLTRKYFEAGKDLEGKGFDPRKLLAPGAEAIKDMVITKIKLFGSEGKADE